MLMWGLHCCLRTMHLAYMREQLYKISRKLVVMKEKYLSWLVHQAILSSTHISLIGVSTPYLDCSGPAVLPCLFSSSLFGRPSSLLISRSDLLSLRSHSLGFFSTLQEGSVLCYHLVPESLNVLQHFLLLLLLHNPPLFSLLSYFGLHLSPGFLNHMFYIIGLYCLL